MFIGMLNAQAPVLLLSDLPLLTFEAAHLCLRLHHEWR